MTTHAADTGKGIAPKGLAGEANGHSRYETWYETHAKHSRTNPDDPDKRVWHPIRGAPDSRSRSQPAPGVQTPVATRAQPTDPGRTRVVCKNLETGTGIFTYRPDLAQILISCARMIYLLDCGFRAAKEEQHQGASRDPQRPSATDLRR
jgi:hypothetical protein